MSKKNALKAKSKNVTKELVEKNLESIILGIQPGLDKKKIGKKIKLAGKILLKGIKRPATGKPAADIKEVAATA